VTVDDVTDAHGKPFKPGPQPVAQAPARARLNITISTV
jgi:hypothetical protein